MVRHALDLAAKGGERPAALRPRKGGPACWQRQKECAALPVALLVAPVRDLLLHAKHLFVAANDGFRQWELGGAFYWDRGPRLGWPVEGARGLWI